MKTIVTKGEYAALKKRKPSAISNWIAEGKISKAALEGEGVRARIWVEQADADLARSLDPAQQAAQPHPVLPPAAAPPDGVKQTPAAAAQGELDADLQRRRKADADKAEAEAIAAVRKNAIEAGQWVEAAVAARAWSGELSKIIAGIETFLCTTLARQLADAHGLDWKKLSVEMRNAFRAHRAAVADEAGGEVKMLEAAE